MDFSPSAMIWEIQNAIQIGKKYNPRAFRKDAVFVHQATVKDIKRKRSTMLNKGVLQANGKMPVSAFNNGNGNEYGDAVLEEGETDSLQTDQENSRDQVVTDESKLGEMKG